MYMRQRGRTALWDKVRNVTATAVLGHHATVSIPSNTVAVVLYWLVVVYYLLQHEKWGERMLNLRANKKIVWED